MNAAKLRFLVISCSLNPASRSFQLARSAEESLRSLGASVELLDLREWDLPFCNGQDSKFYPQSVMVREKVQAATCILMAGPIYNYDLNAAAKNLVELTGKAWEYKIVGFLCSAGGRSTMTPPERPLPT